MADDKLHSVESASEFLGGVSPSTIRAWLTQGRLRRVKVGKLMLVSSRKRLQLVMNPLYISAIFESSFEILHVVIETNLCARRSDGPQLFVRGLGRDCVEDFIVESKFLCLNLRQLLEGLERVYFLLKLRFQIIGPFLFRYKRRTRHPGWPIPPWVERFQHLDARVDR